LCSARSAANFTVAPSGRGYDGTTAQSHSDQAAITHVLDADTVDEVNAHANDAGPQHTAAGIAADAITTTKILDGAVTTAKLDTGAVTAAKIANDTITSAQIAPDAITSSELADNAVDTAAIAANAVTAAKLDAAIPLGTLGYAQVTANQGSIVTETALTGLSKAVTVGAGRRIKITASINVEPSDTTTGAKLRIKEGTTTLRQLGMPRQDPAVIDTIDGSVVLTPSAGVHTYYLTLEADRSGGGSLILQGTSGPCFILIEDIGV
jgi:hypothetical protein